MFIQQGSDAGTIERWSSNGSGDLISSKFHGGGHVHDAAVLDGLGHLSPTKKRHFVAAPVVDAMAGAPASAGHRVNHVCFALSHVASEIRHTYVSCTLHPYGPKE